MLAQRNGATVFILQLPTGRSVVVSNGKHELIVWPAGGWLLYNIADMGLAIGGYEEALETAYLKLRQMAKGPMPEDSEKDRKQRIPKKLLPNRV